MIRSFVFAAVGASSLAIGGFGIFAVAGKPMPAKAARSPAFCRLRRRRDFRLAGPEHAVAGALCLAVIVGLMGSHGTRPGVAIGAGERACRAVGRGTLQGSLGRPAHSPKEGRRGAALRWTIHVKARGTSTAASSPQGIPSIGGCAAANATQRGNAHREAATSHWGRTTNTAIVAACIAGPASPRTPAKSRAPRRRGHGSARRTRATSGSAPEAPRAAGPPRWCSGWPAAPGPDPNPPEAASGTCSHRHRQHDRRFDPAVESEQRACRGRGDIPDHRSVGPRS
jgi:hypothetical protein